MIDAAFAILKGLSWQVYAAIALVGALTFTHGLAYRKGEASTQRDWDAAKVEAQAAQEAADESARLKGHAAALSYENQKAAQVVRVVTITKEVSHAIDAAPAWRDMSIPDELRSAIAAAGQALAASQPDGAVQLPATGSSDERPASPSVRLGPAKLGGLPSPAPGTR